jgi:predicted ATPase/DNA-binding SARP family transcriptional activator
MIVTFDAGVCSCTRRTEFGDHVRSGLLTCTLCAVTVRVRVLGAVELDSASGGPVLRRWPRVRRLLAVLLVHAGEVVSVDRLADVLWGRELPSDPTSGVHNLVSRLRAAIRSAGAADAVRVHTHAPGYLLDVAPGDVDSGRFALLVAAAHARLDDTPAETAALLDQAMALWHGPAFAEFGDEEFARVEAARLDELRRAAVEDRIEADLALGAYEEAIRRLEPLLAADPPAEGPRHQLMRALHGAGRSVEALRVYREYRTALAEELGLDPSPRLGELEGAILRHDPRAGGVAAVSPHNLPQQRGELVGRAEDVDRAIDALRRGRLVTLTGAAGVGKTRLALDVASGLAAEHRDGVWLCELAPVGADAVEQVVAAALGVSRRRALVDHLRAKRLLLVMDNCEHVKAAVALLVDALLRHCPDVRVLATSREPLDVDGERLLPVPPLAVPPSAAGLGTIARAGAVVLFVQRANAASPRFVLAEDNVADVAEICRRLDGLPLALELVAPQVRALSAGEIVAGLHRRLRFVRTTGWVSEQRHRTLRAAVDWSYQLLDAAQREVFDQLSVFVGPFTLDAAERVAGRRGDPAEIRDVLAALVDRSMLDARPERPSTRYSMLETLRHYGLEHLAERGWAAPVRRSHAVYHVELVAAAADGLTGPDPGRWVEALDRHLDDLRAAHGWAVAHDLDLAMRLTSALFWYLEPGMFTEGAGWAERALAACPAAHPLFPMVAFVAAFGATKRGDLEAATRLAEHGLARTDEQDPIRRYGLFALGDVALFQGRLDESGRRYGDAARLAEQAGDSYTHAYAWTNLALPLAYRGESDRALVAARRGRSIAAASGSPHLVAWADYTLSEVLADTDPEQAMAALDAALVVARASGGRFIEGVASVTAASLRARHGDPGEALDLYAAAVEQWHRAGNWIQQWTTLRNVIDLFVRLSDDEAAAVLSAALHASSRAAPLYGTDASRLAVTDAGLQARLPARIHRSCSARGATMTDEEAVAFAKSEIDRLRESAVRATQEVPSAR